MPSKPYRIMHVITRMVRGGAQENTLATVAGIHGGDWDSFLVTGPAEGPEGSLEPDCRARGVRLIHVPELVREVSLSQDVAALKRLVSLMEAEQPHLVHTHTSKAGILGRVAARRVGIPVVHTPHGHVFQGYASWWKTRLFIEAERRTADLAHTLVALTHNERDEHLAQRIGRPEQWQVIHSGINFAPFEAARGLRDEVRRELGMDPAATVIGTVGRLVEIKGQKHLLAALPLLRNASAVEVVLVGDGPLAADLRRQARELNLAVVEGTEPAAETAGPRLRFLGLRTDVPRLLAAFDLFVLPSLNEGMGRALVEAMAMELPCVASRVSGIPDVVVDGETGLLTTPGSATELASALQRLIDDPELARRMGEAGRHRAVPGFSVEAMLRRLEGLYRSILEAPGRSDL